MPARKDAIQPHGDLAKQAGQNRRETGAFRSILDMETVEFMRVSQGIYSDPSQRESNTQIHLIR